MPAHCQLNGIGDDIARHQRGFHALVTHGDAVGHGDCGELARRAAGLVDTRLGGLRLTPESDVTWRRFVPSRRHADDRPVHGLARDTHRVKEGAVRRALGTFRDVAAGHIGFIELGTHFSLHLNVARS